MIGNLGDAPELVKELEKIDDSKLWEKEQLSKVKEAMDKVKGAKKQFQESDIGKFVNLVNNLTLVYSSLEATVKSIQDLIKIGQQLASSAQSDFIGPNALKLPAIVEGIKGSMENLKKIPEESVKTVEALKNMIEMISASFDIKKPPEQKAADKPNNNK